MDKLRSMEIFVAVVDAGNFTAAARAFQLSPVMVGKHIAHLEATLGARLLTRTTRRQSLTEIGAQYVEQCRVILAQIAAAETGAEAMRSVPRGRLRITAPVSFGSEWLAPAISDYLRLHPEVGVDLNLNDRMVDMVEEGYDAAVHLGLHHDAEILERGHAQRLAALKDFGIVMQAEVLLAQDIAAGRLVPVLCDYLPPARPMHLVYQRDRRATPKLTTFIDFIVERFGPAAALPLASSA